VSAAPATTVVRAAVPGEDGAIYTRLLATRPDGPHRGALLLTAEIRDERAPHGPVFPVWRSDDGGLTWELIAEVADERHGAGNRYQPVLYELPGAWAGLEAGTLLLAGNSIPRDMRSTRLVVYVADGSGRRWRHLSDVDSGGPAEYDPRADSTTSAIWEPSLDLIGDRLVCYFADERRKRDRMLQVLVHRTALAPDEWSEPVLDFGVADAWTRPGMFVATGRMPDGRRHGVFEVVGPPRVPVRWASSPDGLDWGAPGDLGRLLEATDGTTLAGTPNVAWRVDDRGRTIVIVTGRVSLDRDGRVTNRALVNVDGGDGAWRSFELPTPAVRTFDDDGSGYSQSLVWNPDGRLVHATTVKDRSGDHDIVVTVADQPDW
jgi:hypothetical protein